MVTDGNDAGVMNHEDTPKAASVVSVPLHERSASQQSPDVNTSAL